MRCPLTRTRCEYQADAEKALARVMIRTGKTIAEVCGDDLLFYADVVRTSGGSDANTSSGSCWSRWALAGKHRR